MSVREYLCFAAELKGLSRERADMETILARTQLADVQNRPCGKLSKGYQQRVGLAQAVLGYPELIVLDEPTIAWIRGRSSQSATLSAEPGQGAYRAVFQPYPVRGKRSLRPGAHYRRRQAYR